MYFCMEKLLQVLTQPKNKAIQKIPDRAVQDDAWVWGPKYYLFL